MKLNKKDMLFLGVSGIATVLIFVVFMVFFKPPVIKRITATNSPKITGAGYNILSGPVTKPTQLSM